MMAVIKLLIAEQSRHLAELGMDLAAAVVGRRPELVRSHLRSRAMTIADRTSEITRNTIAEGTLRPLRPLLK